MRHGGDKYRGLDRFGRVVDQQWHKAASGGAAAAYTDRFAYGYDANSSRTSRDVTAPSAPSGLNRDEAYTYDPLDRLAKVNRGTLSGGTISDANATFSL